MASNSEGSDSGAEPRPPPSLGAQVLDLNDQFEQQQSVINEVKEGLRKNKQDITGKGKELEEYASKLNSIKSRSRASNRSPRPGAVSSPGALPGSLLGAGAPPGAVSSPGALPGALLGAGAVEPTVATHKDPDKLTPSKSLLFLRQKVNENKLILEQRGREMTESKRGVAVMLEQMKTQLEERDSTIEILQTKLSSPDVTGRLHHGSGASQDAVRKHLNLDEQTNVPLADVEETTGLTHNGKITELHNKVIELQGVIVGLQENLLEKDSVINARTKAIALMSEDLCRKGKTTLDQLDETKEEMRRMQNNFIQFEANMNKEKAGLCEQIQTKDLRLHQLEDTNSELTTIRNELTARISQLQNVEAKSSDDTTALTEANKQIVKLKAQTKKQLKQIHSLKDSNDTKKIHNLENKIAELEEEKVSESNSLRRIAELEDELKTRMLLVEEMKLQLDCIPGIKLEKSQLEELVAQVSDQLEQMKHTKVSAELKSVQLEEDVDIIAREKLYLEESLAEKMAALEYIPQMVAKQSLGMSTQTPKSDTVENFTQTLLANAEKDEVLQGSDDSCDVSTQTSLSTEERDVQTFEMDNKMLTAAVNAGQEEIATQTLDKRSTTVETQTADATPSDDLEQLRTSSTQDNSDAQLTISLYEDATARSKAHIDSLEMTLDETRLKLESRNVDLVTKDDLIKNLSRNSETLEQNIAQMKKELEALLSKNASQAEKIMKLAINLKAKKTQLNSCQAEIKELKVAVDKSDKSLLALTSENEEMKKASQKSNAEANELAAQWNAEKLELKEIVKNYKDLEREFLQEKSESTSRMNYAEMTANHIGNHLQSLEQEMDRLRLLLEEREAYIQSLLQEKENNYSTFTLSMDRIQEENSGNLAIITMLEAAKAVKEKAVLEAQAIIDKLESELIETRQLAQANSEKATLEAQAIIDKLESELIDTRQLAQANSEKATLEAQAIIDKLESELIETRQLAQANSERGTLEAQAIIDKLESELIETRQLAQANSEKATLEAQAIIDKLESELIETRQLATEIECRLNQNLAAKDAKLEEQQAVLEDQLIQFIAMQEKANRIESNLYEKITLEEKLRSENDKLQGICEQSENLALDFANTRSFLEQRLAESECEIKKLRSTLLEQEGNVVENNALVSELQVQVIKLEKALVVVQKKLDESIDENNRLIAVEQDFIDTSGKLVAIENEMKKSTAMHLHDNNLLIEELEKASSNLDSLCIRYNDCESIRRELATKCDELLREKAMLEKEIFELNQAACNQEEHVKELTISLESLESDVGKRQLLLSEAKNDQSNQMFATAKEEESMTITNLVESAQMCRSSEDADQSDPEWAWGTDDALLEEIHQNKTSESVLLLEAEIKTLGAKNSELAEELKNSQSLGGKLVKKVKELKQQNSMLTSKINASSTSLDQTIELEFASQISSLEKEVLALKAEKDVLVGERNKLNTQLEGLLWQQSELKEDRLRLSEELEWKNHELYEIKQIKQIRLNLATEGLYPSDELPIEETKDSEEELDRSVIQSECEELKQALEEREKEIISMKESLLSGDKQLETFAELEGALQMEMQGLKLDLSARVQENNRLSHVLLEQEKSLFEANSKYLARDREAYELETNLQIKNSEIEVLSQELKEQLNVIQLLKAVQKNVHDSEQASESAGRRLELGGDNKELDHALYRLHQKEVRCDELTIELMQLLEERDTLQLRLSVSLRKNEDHKNTPHPSGTPEKNVGDSIAEASAIAETGQGVLANKLDQLRSVGREQRQMALQQQQRGDVALDANYMPPEQENEQESFFQWFWGRSTPKVMDV